MMPKALPDASRAPLPRFNRTPAGTGSADGPAARGFALTEPGLRADAAEFRPRNLADGGMRRMRVRPVVPARDGFDSTTARRGRIACHAAAKERRKCGTSS